MRREDSVCVEKFRYGRGSMEVAVPERNYAYDIVPPALARTPSPATVLQTALDVPIGTSRLEDLCRGKKRVAVVVNDLTRPTPTRLLLRSILKRLRAVGVGEDIVTLLVATGTHRPPTQEELIEMIGEPTVSTYRIISHDCRDSSTLLGLGESPSGVPVVLNRPYCEADLRILTGTIAPHQSAGYSGGRKSIMPGLAGLESIRVHHSAAFRPDGPAMGCVEGNPFHEAATEIARMAPADFIVNVVQTGEDRIVGAVAGDMEKAWYAGVSMCQRVCECRAPGRVDIVVVGAGGFPRDRDLYQAQKAMASAEVVVKEGGVIVLVAECREGVGSPGFLNLMKRATSPSDALRKFREEGYGEVGSSKGYLFARALVKASLIVVSDRLGCEEAEILHSRVVASADEALRMAFAKVGANARVAVIRNGVAVIPQCGEV